MTNPNANSSTVEEMDLTDIFALFKRMFYSFLAFCFKILDFMLKFWWVILLLIIAGFSLGYFTKGAQKYGANLIVKTNYKSQPYVYTAVKQFMDNLKEGDEAFITSVGLNPEDTGIGSIKIEPVIDVLTLIEEMQTSDRTLGTIIDELSEDDEVELFATDRFYSNFKYHKVEAVLTSPNGKEKIEALLNYINGQPLMQQLKTEAVKNLKDRIAHNEKTLDQIDEMIARYADKEVGKIGSNLAYYNNQNNLNVNGTLEFKNELAIETELLKNDLITYQEAAVVVSDVQTAEVNRFKDKKEIIYPVIFVFLFLLAAGCINGYRMLKRKIEAEGYLA